MEQKLLYLWSELGREYPLQWKKIGSDWPILPQEVVVPYQPFRAALVFLVQVLK